MLIKEEINKMFISLIKTRISITKHQLQVKNDSISFGFTDFKANLLLKNIEFFIFSTTKTSPDL